MLPVVRPRASAPSVLTCAFIALAPLAAAAQTATVRVAYWNIQSGKGEPALAGNPVTFSDTSNCTDPMQPLNAWGTGLVQAHLQ